MKRIKADLIVRNIGQLATVRGHSRRPCVSPRETDLGLIGKPDSRDACVASKSGMICFAGKSNALSETINTSSAAEIDAMGHLVIPGFVDPHTHAIFAGSREKDLSEKLSGLSYLEILARGGGILKTMRDTRSASDSQITNETASRLRRMLYHGTTTVEVKSGYGLDLGNEIRILRIIKNLQRSLKIEIVPTLLSAHAIPPEFSKRNKMYIKQVVEPSIDIASKEELAEFCDVFMEEGVFGAEESFNILSYARTKGLKLKIHADEFSDLGGASLAAKLGVVSADHLMKASPQGMRLLAKAGIVSVLLPGTTLSSFAKSYADARNAIRQGCAIALGTDFSPGSWLESMQLVISLACYGMKMTPAEALIASTINGAHAISRQREIGSIEEGKQCDLLIMNLSNYEEIPYRIGVNSVSTVIKRGKLASRYHN